MLAIALQGGCGAPAPAPPGPEVNAAEEYRALSAAMAPALVEAARSGDLSADTERLLADASAIRDRLVWVSRAPSCDWDIDYSSGLEALLPHLGPNRNLARMLDLDAQLASRRGDTTQSANNVAALIRMSRHVDGRAVLEDLVAISYVELATQRIVDDADSWTSAERAFVLAELDQVDVADPFGLSGDLAWIRNLAAQAGEPPPDEARIQHIKETMAASVERARQRLR